MCKPFFLRPFLLVALCLLCGYAWAPRACAEPYKPGSGPYAVQTSLLELQDAVRNRLVPIKVYLPVGAEGRRPVVLVSHGLGGTREGLSYLGQRWASHGYVCVHMQHLGSDDGVWRGLKGREVLPAMRKVANNPQHALNRAGDTVFVLDQLERMHAERQADLFNRLDLSRIGMAGHSFGAWTTLAAGGMQMPTGQSFVDERIKCIIPLSSPSVGVKRLREKVYKPIAVPSLHMTGTLDTTAVNNTGPDDRRVPYDHTPGPSGAGGGPPKYLIFFDGADHMTFSGESGHRLRSKVAPQDNEAFHRIILESTTAFIDCYLLGDTAAQRWLDGGGFVARVGERGAVEMDVESR